MNDQGRSRPQTLAAATAEQWLAAAVWNVSNVFSVGYIGPLVLAFLVSRTAILADLHPFGIALVAALFAVVPGRALAGALGAVLGVMSQATPVLVVEQAIILIFFAISRTFSHDSEVRVTPAQNDPVRRRRYAATMAITVFFSFFFVHGAYAYVFGGDAVGLSPYKLLAVALGGTIAAISTIIFYNALVVVQARQTEALSGDSLAPFFVLATAVSGLTGLHVGPARLEAVIASVVIMAASWLGGPATGAACGVLMGSVTSPGGLFYPPLMGRLALGGLTAGYFTRLGRFGTAAGYLVASMSLTYYLLQPDAVVATLWESGAAVAIFLLIPSHLFGQILVAWQRDRAQRKPPKLSNQVMPPSLSVIRTWFDSAQAATSADEAVRPQVTERLRHFAAVFEELSRSFEQVAPAAAPEHADPEDIVEPVVQRACRGCQAFERCWDERFYHTYQAVLELFSRLELEETVSTTDVLARVPRCAKPDIVADELVQLFDRRLLEHKWALKLGETRSIVSTQLRGASEVMEKLAGEVEHERRTALRPLVADRTPRLAYTLGVSRRAKQPGNVSGDSYLVRDLPDDRAVFVLSDGMGAGPRACYESKTTTELLCRLLEAGFAPDVAIRTINSVLLFRSPDDVFATVDMVLFEFSGGGVDFMKVGAAPSYIKRGQRVIRVEANTLPVGILNEVDVEIQHQALGAGDIVVMVTDGILNSRDQGIRDHWLMSYLRTCGESDTAQDIAEDLVQAALQMDEGAHADDLTALVFRVGRTEEEPRQRREYQSA